MHNEDFSEKTMEIRKELFKQAKGKREICKGNT